MPSTPLAVRRFSPRSRNPGLAGRHQSEHAVLLLELVTLPRSLLEFVFIAFPGWRLVS
jgi:hypothetical protein